MKINFINNLLLIHISTNCRICWFRDDSHSQNKRSERTNQYRGKTIQ